MQKEGGGRGVLSGKLWGKETDIATRRNRRKMGSRKQDYRAIWKI